MDLEFEVVDFAPQFTDGLLVDLDLDLVFVLGALLLVEEERT